MAFEAIRGHNLEAKIVPRHPQAFFDNFAKMQQFFCKRYIESIIVNSKMGARTRDMHAVHVAPIIWNFQELGANRIPF